MPKTKPVADELQSTILRSTDNDVKRIKHIAKYILFTPDELGRFEFLTKGQALTQCTLLEEVQDQADKISHKI